MISKKRGLMVLALILLSFVVSICFYPHMPEKIATHFNAKGEADGYSGKFFGTFCMPITLVILVLFLVFVYHFLHISLQCPCVLLRQDLL